MPNYPEEVAWGNIQGILDDQTDLKNALNAKQNKLSFNYKSDIIQDSSNVLKTVYGGSHIIFTNAGNPGLIDGNTIDLSLPELI